MNIPKKGVSGDLYDYVSRDGQIYFCMADVSGKGTDAALVMAKTHSLFRSLSRNMPAVNELAARMNGELVETAFNGMFVTAIIGQYDSQASRSACNAGEPGLLVDGKGRFSYVEASPQPLGILDFAPHEIDVAPASKRRGFSAIPTASLKPSLMVPCWGQPNWPPYWPSK